MGIWFVMKMIMVCVEYPTRTTINVVIVPPQGKNLIFRRALRMTIMRSMDMTVRMTKRSGSMYMM